MKALSTILLAVIVLVSCGQVKTKKTNTGDEKLTEIKKPETPASKSSVKRFDFENYEIGKLPQGWSQYATGEGEDTEWRILDDNGNKVLAQLSNDNPNYHFNEVVFDELEARNVDLRVRLKGVTGKMDQGGGFVWRFKDADNYYVVRANPLEDNVVLYKVEKGVRTDLPLVGKGKTYGMETEPLGQGWNTLRLVVKDSLFTVYINGKELFKVEDTTFAGKGKVGLWTKADAVSYFDDFEITLLD